MPALGASRVAWQSVFARALDAATAPVVCEVVASWLIFPGPFTCTLTDAFDSGVMSCAVVFGLLALAGLAVAVALLREVKIEQ